MSKPNNKFFDIFEDQKKEPVVQRSVYYPQNLFNDFNKLCSLSNKSMNSILIEAVRKIVNENSEILKPKK
jgi:hypothetical protein